MDSGHNLEFVTDPLDSERDLVVALYEMIQLVNQMKEGAQRTENRYVFKPPGEGKNGWRVGEEAPITIEDLSFQSRVQVTEGVPMKNIPDLIQSFLGEDKRYAELMKVIAENDNLGITPKVKGLVSAVEMYISAMKDKQPDPGEGPKTMFTLMARSNFKAMHDRLASEEREEFYRVIGLEGDTLKPENLLTKKLGIKPGDELYHKWTHNYNKGQVVKKYPAGPTLEQWIVSIRSGENPANQSADLLSPPPGLENFEHTSTNQELPYSMGTYQEPMDSTESDLIKFEMRGLTSQTGYHTFDRDIVEFSRELFHKANSRNPEELDLASDAVLNFVESEKNWKRRAKIERTLFQLNGLHYLQSFRSIKRDFNEGEYLQKLTSTNEKIVQLETLINEASEDFGDQLFHKIFKKLMLVQNDLSTMATNFNKIRHLNSEESELKLFARLKARRESLGLVRELATACQGNFLEMKKLVVQLSSKRWKEEMENWNPKKKRKYKSEQTDNSDISAGKRKKAG